MTDLRRGMLLPSELRMIEIVHKESKWYSLNNQLVQVLWCQNFFVLLDLLSFKKNKKTD